MRILLTSHMPHLTTVGGAQKALRAAVEALSARHHEVRVVSVEANPPALDVRRTRGGARVARCGGVDIEPARDIDEMLGRARALCRRWQPDVVLVPAEDIHQRPLRGALQLDAPVVVVCQTPATLPFGPGAAAADGEKAAWFERAQRVLATSHFLADYIQTYGVTAVPVTLPAWPRRAPRPDRRFAERPHALFINPSVIKGLPIFVAVGAALWPRRFAAVPTWATTATDLDKLREMRNLTLRAPERDIFRLLEAARVLLVPSLWLENAPLIITEAMLAGVPVIASDVGGIPEVMQGAGTRLPVNQVTWETDDSGCVSPFAPEQPVGPWIEATAQIMDHEERWAHERQVARDAATAFVSGIDIRELESELIGVAA